MSNPRKAPAKRRGTPRKAAKKRQICVRMYNVGFGDCFLIRIPTTEGERRMLVDCGYHSQGKGQFSDKDLVEQITKDLDGAPLDVVVATHRHQDHISGFGEAELWKKIAVDEVWLPFTAHPDAADAEPALRAWHGLMERAGEFLVDGELTAQASAALGAREPQDREAVKFMLWNARANAPGIQNLLDGMARKGGGRAKRRFLPESKKFPSRIVTAVLPGVTTHVLGPPRDPKLRKSLKVPASWGVTDEVVMGETGGGDLGSPFGEEWRVPIDRLSGRLPFQERTLNSIRRFNDDLLHAARAVDGFLNGESLVLVIEFGNARLLLPGDAEVGTWTAILANPAAAALAASATFLKVGHHGSHNATPLAFVKTQLAKLTPAVISTQEGRGNYRNGIPLDELLSAMTDRGMPFVRSDKPPMKRKGIFTPGEGQRWVDCAIPC